MNLRGQLLSSIRMTAVIFIFTILVSARSAGQSITYSGKNIPLEKIFRTITKQTGYVFFYRVPELAEAKPVTVDWKHTPLIEVLQTIFKGQAYSFHIEGNTVVVTRTISAVHTVTDTAIHALPGVGKNITGHVQDSAGQPLSGASVTIKGTGKGIEADNKGNFVLKNVSDYTVIIVSYTGFQPKQLLVGNGQFLSVVLSPNTSALNDVQVIAYGTQIQRFNVGSVATVSSKEIQQQPVTNVLQALEGRVPGLSIQSTSGAPGGSVMVQIRGQNTLSPSNYMQVRPFDQPLFVIDGVPFAPQNQNINQNQSLGTKINVAQGNPYSGMSPFNSINPADIESISVLKDADATSIYGTQGANGVILITTKKGRAGKSKLNLNVNSGSSFATSPVTMMNTQQYRRMRKQAFVNDGLPMSDNANDPGYAPDITLFDSTKYTDWYKYFEGGTANTTNATLNLSGGSQYDQFYLSAGYTHSGYNFPGGFADNRISLHSNFKHQSKDLRFSVEFGSDYAYDRNNASGRPSLLTAFTLAPNYPDLLDKNGNPIWSYNGFGLGSYGDYFNGTSNPLAYLKQTENLNSYNLTTHLNLSYKIVEGLSVAAMIGFNKFDVEEHGASPGVSLDPAHGQLPSASFHTNHFQTLDIAPQLNYERRISKGELKVLAGAEYKKNSNASTNTTGYGYSNDALLGTISAASSVSAYDAYSIYKYIGFFARIGYIWDKRYILNFSGRRDGSSNFGPGNKYGNFGSAGIGWILSEESFCKQNMPVLSFAKLSASYGSSGGDGIAAYQYQPNWATNYYGVYQNIRAYYPLNLFNPDYSWSLSKKLNTSLDLGFFNDRILLNLTFYKNRIGKQLVSYVLPGQTGFGGVLENSPATIENQGWEAMLTTRNVQKQDFSWSTSFNISTNRNKLVSFPGLEFSDYLFNYKIGRSVNEQYFFNSGGVDPATGLFRFIDANGHYTQTPQYRKSTAETRDQYVREDPTPAFTAGLTNTITYKAFNLSLFFQGAKQRGLTYLNSVYTNFVPGAFGINVPVQLNSAWQQPGDNAPMQKYSTGYYNMDAYDASSNFQASNGVWGDASYIRLKTIAVSYNFPAAFTKRLGLQSGNMYINAQNLLTITGYEVGDPELQTLYGFPLQRTIVAGINVTF